MRTVYVIISLALLTGGILMYCSDKAKPTVAEQPPAPLPVKVVMMPRQASSPRLPAPRNGGAAQESAKVEENKVQQLMAWLETEEAGRLKTEQLAGYLAKNQRNAESLLTAYRTTGDKALLQEALEKYPRDPQVNYTALFLSDTAEERNQRLAALKQAAPNNALADYLAAHDHFKAGHPAEALLELKTATGKADWEDYSRAFIQTYEEAYRAAGYAEAEAKALAGTSLFPPHLAEMKTLGRELSKLATQYEQAGDTDSGRTLRQMGLALGERYEAASVNSTLMKSIIGINIQSQMLAALDPASPYDTTGRTVKDERDALLERRAALTELSRQWYRIMPTLSEPELILYFDRQKALGEMAAMKWLIRRQKKP